MTDTKKEHPCTMTRKTLYAITHRCYLESLCELEEMVRRCGKPLEQSKQVAPRSYIVASEKADYHRNSKHIMRDEGSTTGPIPASQMPSISSSDLQTPAQGVNAATGTTIVPHLCHTKES